MFDVMWARILTESLNNQNRNEIAQYLPF